MGGGGWVGEDGRGGGVEIIRIKAKGRLPEINTVTKIKHEIFFLV